MVIAVDFDGVLHDPKNKVGDHRLGQPIPGAVEAMNRLKSKGYILVIHSVWANTDKTQFVQSEWLRYFGIPYDFITNKKPKADFYIDDHGLKFENWPDTLRTISSADQAQVIPGPPAREPERWVKSQEWE